MLKDCLLVPFNPHSLGGISIELIANQSTPLLRREFSSKLPFLKACLSHSTPALTPHVPFFRKTVSLSALQPWVLCFQSLPK